MELVGGINEVDLGITCECTLGHRCTCQAAYIVKVHVLGDCQNMRAKNRTPQGQWYGLMCGACLKETVENVARIIIKGTFSLPMGSELSCSTCGLVVHRVGDLLEAELLL